MNRSFRDYAATTTSTTTANYNSSGASRNHRRGNSFTATATATARTPDENLDLFSRSRRSVSLTPSSLDSEVSGKLGKISVGSVKLGARNGLDDLLTSADSDGGKHDYDWLLTPPETPLCASSERSDFQSTSATPRNRSASRSTSTTKPSRLSTAQLDNGHSSRPARSSSVTRPSISSPHNTTYSSNRNPSSILNTSSASVSSYIRPSSPISRSSSTARPSTPSSRTTASRPSTPSSRTTTSRPSTPSKAHSLPTISSGDRTRPSQNSRPSTPSSRSQVPANSSFPAIRSNSRPSTPTRRSPSSNSLAAPNMSVSTGRVMSNGRTQTSTSRPSSPSPRIRSQQPVIPPDFPLDTPPNLRTTLPDRPVSAGRSRPGAVASKLNTESPSSTSMSRRPSSPTVSRGRSVEPQGRGHLHSNGHYADISEPRKSAYVSDSMRKPIKASTTLENGSMGRTISKKSIDMAIRHMDIRNGSGSMRPLPSTSLFPQSIRSAPSKIQTTHGSGSPTSINSNGSPSLSSNGSILENGTYANGLHENGKKEENGRLFGRLAGADMYESTRYDAILLKEDLKNTTWLHSMDDMSDQCSIFENGFEPLPEPFGLS